MEGVGGIIPDWAEAGWVAPKELRNNHGYQYYAGDFQKVLPNVLEDMPPIDLAIYDASKDPTEMKMAYERLIQSLSAGGVLISDDIEVNDVFNVVTTQHEGNTVEFGGIGIFRTTTGCSPTETFAAH